jgi:hypothetical protein
MSVVSGVVVCARCAEQSGSAGQDGPPLLFERISTWLAERDFGPLTMVEDSFGGSKHPQMSVGGAGFNHFPEDDFVSFVLG